MNLTFNLGGYNKGWIILTQQELHLRTILLKASWVLKQSALFENFKLVWILGIGLQAKMQMVHDAMQMLKGKQAFVYLGEKNPPGVTPTVKIMDLSS